MDPLKITLRDRLLIGEFVRRHHHRLAHEIALMGVPGPSDIPISLKAVRADVADLSGLVARSHGIPIRSCISYIDRYHLRDYNGIHTIFLMTVLRIADYLQVQAERASKQLLQVMRLRSPFSQGEWKAHHAIRNIHQTHEDPEAIFIEAAPADIFTYLRLKHLLMGIQQELDLSWAVLGEIYGRYSPLDRLAARV